MNRISKIGVASVLAIAAGTVIVGSVSAEPCEVDVVVDSISPARGFVSGGTQLTMTGTNFETCGISRVSFDGADGTDLTIAAAGELIVVTPPGSGTVVPRLYYGDDQFADAPSFTFVNVPAVDHMLPPKGPATGGTALAVWGTNLIADDATTQVRFGDTTVDASILGDGYLEAISPASNPGVVDVSVVITLDTGEQSASAASPFTFVPAPSVATVVDDAGAADGGDVIEVTGENFQRGARVFMGRADGGAPAGGEASRFEDSNPAPAVEYVNSGLLRVLTPAGAPGVANLLVVNPDGQVGGLIDGFTYDGQAPTLTSAAPGSGSSLGGTQVTISGSGFDQGASVEFGSGDDRRDAASVVVDSSTQITATAPPHPPGGVTITVGNPDGGTATLTGGFNYTAAAPPSAASLDALTGSSLGGGNLTLLGAGFASGAVVRFGDLAGDGREAPAAVVDSGRIIVTTPAHPAGVVNVLVVNPDGQTSSPLTFTYQAAPPPTVGSVSPPNGPTAGGTLVTISGSGFVDGSQITIGGVAIVAEVDPATGVLPLVRNSSTIIGRTPPGTAGAAAVVITNPDGAPAIAPGQFTYAGPPAPVVNAITPNVGTSTGGQAVELTGSDFAPGSIVTFGNGDCSSAGTPACNLRATNVVVSPTSITAVTPAGLFGYQNVTVIGPDGLTSTLRYGFDFGDGAEPPSIDDISPPVAASGETITITGSGYVDGAQALIGSQILTAVIELDGQGNPTGSLPIVRDDSTLVGVVPRRAGGTYPVSVVNPDGQALILNNAFNYPTDTTAPTTTATATTGTPPVQHPFGSNSWARGPVSVSLSADDGQGGSGVDFITYSTSGAQTITSTLSSGSTVSFVLSNQGITTIEFASTDIAGVSEQPASRVVAIDSMAPSIIATSTFVPGTQTNQDVDVEFTCADNTGGSGLGVAPLSASSSSTITQTGSNPLTVTFTDAGIGQSVTATCTDSAGNIATRSFTGVNISRNGPTLTAVAATADGRPYQSQTWTHLNVVVTFVCRAPGTVGPLRSPQVASVTPPQIISSSVTDLTVEGECRDSAGNIATTSFTGIRVDKQRPVAGVVATSGGATYVAGTWTNVPVVLTFTCTDDGPNQSGVATVTDPLTISAPGSTAGGSGTCLDVAGNRANPAVFLGPISVDDQPPTCSLIVTPNPIGPANAKMVTVAVTLTAMDDRAGIQTVTLLAVTSSRPGTASADITGFSTGTDDRMGSLRTRRGNIYTLTYVVADRAGTQSAPCTATVTVS